MKWWREKHESGRMMLSALWVQSSWEIYDLKRRPENGWESRAERLHKNAHTLIIENTFVLNGQTVTWRTFFMSNWPYRWQSFQMNLSRKINRFHALEEKTKMLFLSKDTRGAEIYAIKWYKLRMALFNFKYSFSARNHVLFYVIFSEYLRRLLNAPRRWVSRSRDAAEAGHPRFLHRFGSDVGGVPVWKKWALAMNGFDHSEIRSAESVNGAKTGP